ncbi:unnamed protein product [Prorocentrum cordatum]|uniref:Altered inheritance of mitochondria protein 24, mitochondrial n=1 Tax=Prorocentrum cordatum TaxID=2364126 RepID=A0ABN9Y4E4_9DINO|nr:unnamed protein product [Polarella glacialis]
MFGPGAAQPRPPHEVLEESATDAEAAGASGGPWAAPRRAGVACAAAALAAAAAGALAGRPLAAEPLLGTAPAAEATSLLSTGGAEGVAGLVRSEGVGCGNWHTASLEMVQTGDAATCAQNCRDTAGCVAVNYQATQCPEKPEEQDGQGTCYMLSEACTEGPNECWDAYTLPESERKGMAMGSRVSRSTGCSNLDQITKGGETMEWSVYTCAYKCEEDAACVGMLYEAEPCGNRDEGRRCVLLYGECSEDDGESYACWDISYKSSSGAGAPVGAAELPPSRETLWTPAAPAGATAAAAAGFPSAEQPAVASPPNPASGATTDVLEPTPASGAPFTSAATHAGATAGTAIAPSAAEFALAPLSDSALGAPAESSPVSGGSRADAKVVQGLFKTTQDVLAGQREIVVDLPNCFLIGDTIQLFDWKDSVHQNHRIVSKDPILITPAVEHTFFAGTSVLRINHPFAASTCGEWPHAAPDATPQPQLTSFR